MAKQARVVLREKLGTMTPLTVRAGKSTHHEKRVELDRYKKLIHGYREGKFVNKGGVVFVAQFEGSGLPDETIKPPKTNQERAEADKRKPLRVEWCAGFRPRGFGKKIAARETRGFNAA